MLFTEKITVHRTDNSENLIAIGVKIRFWMEPKETASRPWSPGEKLDLKKERKEKEEK